MKNVHKQLCIWLCVCILLGIFTSCDEASSKQPALSADDGYSKLAQIFADNGDATEMLQTMDLLLQDNTKPSVQDYTKALITTMVTYDKKHASQIAEQYKTDNLRLAKEKNMDFAAMEADVTSIMMDMGASTAVFQEKFSDFFALLSNVEDTPVHWLYTVSELETVMQNYTKYHTFLQTTRNNTAGTFSNAAYTLQEGMEKAAEKIVQEFAHYHDTEPTLGDHSEYFFSECFFSGHCMNTEANSIDSNLQTLIDTALPAITSIEATPATPIPGGDAWKKAYIDFIFDNDLDDIGSFQLLNIDNDAIPELYCSSNFVAGGDDLCSYYNGTVIVQHMYLDGLYYFEGQNFFLDSGGKQDIYYADVYSIENGSFSLLHEGDYGFLDGRRDENGEKLYDYYWDNERFDNEEEFLEAVYAVFDVRKATFPNDTVSFGEITKAILCY